MAKLSGMPEELINRASEILKVYEEGKKTIERPNIQLEMQFETSEKDTIKEFMEEVDPLNLTPLEAINKLYELKELIKGG